MEPNTVHNGVFNGQSQRERLSILDPLTQPEPDDYSDCEWRGRRIPDSDAYRDSHRMYHTRAVAQWHSDRGHICFTHPDGDRGAFSAGTRATLFLVHSHRHPSCFV